MNPKVFLRGSCFEGFDENDFGLFLRADFGNFFGGGFGDDGSNGISSDTNLGHVG